MARQYAKGSEKWPDNAVNLDLKKVVELYEGGFSGVYLDEDARDRFDDTMRRFGSTPDGGSIISSAGFAESGAGKLSIPFVWPMLFFPGCWPGPGQDVGDCVSWSEVNSNMTSYAIELMIGRPDEVTGNLEAVPEIPARGLKSGAFATEPCYWFRGRDSHGWSCDESSDVSMKFAGLVTRDNHPGIGIDLTKYSGKKASAYGRRGPPSEVIDAIDNNLIRKATRATSFEERRDFIANGYAIHTCGSQGYSNKRDENGVSKRTKTWHHAMEEHGVDDRPIAKQKYGGPLELVQNSWSHWNSGSRDIMDSAPLVPGLVIQVQKVFGLTEADAKQKLLDCDVVNKDTGSIMIPPGSFWSRTNDWSNRRFIVKGSVDGFPAREISLGLDGYV